MITGIKYRQRATEEKNKFMIDTQVEGKKMGKFRGIER